MDKALLNPAQKNSIRIALRLLEERLFWIETLLSQKEHRGILYSFQNDLSHSQISHVQTLFQEIEGLIARFKEVFDLPSEEEKLSQIMNGSTSYFWSIIADKKADKLKRYGDVSPDLSRELDPLVDHLIALLNEIKRVLGNPEG
ncbi:MAG: hypothetical protein GXO76_12855 [Calditrichaeota bacterium]|nr:hypothetical protein [Calditrichota bacterium]